MCDLWKRTIDKTRTGFGKLAPRFTRSFMGYSRHTQYYLWQINKKICHFANRHCKTYLHKSLIVNRKSLLAAIDKCEQGFHWSLANLLDKERIMPYKIAEKLISDISISKPRLLFNLILYIFVYMVKSWYLWWFIV